MKLRKAYLQLRWERETSERPSKPGDICTHLCHYELVLPLCKYDIRREIYKNGSDTGRRTPPYLIVPMSGPTKRSGTGTPCVARDGTLFADTPYRDGAHARWDAKRMGGLLIFVIALDGTKMLYEREKP